jgi:hypothetical protein
MQPDYEIKNINDLPKEAGKYNIEIEGVRTMMPIYLNFDGKNWTDLDEVKNTYCFSDHREIHYYALKEQNVMTKKNKML